MKTDQMQNRPEATNPNSSWAQPTAPPPTPTERVADDENTEALEILRIEQQANGGANWFFWIAGLSVINSLITIADFGIFFPVGLGVTQIVDSFAIEGGAGGQLVALFFGAIVASIFVFFGVMARKRQSWAFIVGLVLYAADALLFFLVQDWLSIGFHVWGCIGIYGGLAATRRLMELGVGPKPASFRP